jgi:gamma-butyrobetaine dioxygenase
MGGIGALGDRTVTLEWDDGSAGEFHYIWLRDNCACADCRHPDAWERLLDNVLIDLDVTPSEIAFNDHLDILWSDGHETMMSADWLRSHRYGIDAREKRREHPILWTADITNNPPKISLEEIDGGDDGLLRWLTLIRDYGFSIVTGVPTHVGAVVDLAQRIAFIQETHFGREFQVISKPDPENLAYTAVKLNSHTDVPNRHGLPGLQFLHCIQFEAEGGESILIDGFEAARRLRDQHPEMHDLLATAEVPYIFEDEGHDVRNHERVITTDPDGNHTEVRFHQALLGAIDLDPELIEPFYAAWQAFGKILRDPEMEYVFKMEPGECQVFDNRRVLHARAEFDPNTGPRHLQGTYVERDDFMSRLRVLEREGRSFRIT